MIREPRKLKRGLKDISALFEESRAKNSQDTSIPSASVPSSVCSQKGKISCLSVYDALNPKESLFYGGLLGNFLARSDRPVTIASFGNEETAQSLHHFGSHLKYLALKWPMGVGQETQLFDEESLPNHHEVVFWNFPRGAAEDYSEILKTLDHWIFVLHPSSGSFLESYRQLKWMNSLQMPISYGLIYEGDKSDPRAEILFEKFSMMASKHLGMNLSWWGHMRLPREGKVSQVEVNFDQMFSSQLSERVSPIRKRTLVHQLKEQFLSFSEREEKEL